MDYVIGERELAPVLALVHRTTVTMQTIGDGIGGAFRVLVEHAGATGAQWAGPPFVLYPEACDGEFEIAVCMPVAPGATSGEGASVEEVPGGLCAGTLHVGPYSEIGKAYVALQKWMTDNGRRPAGLVREVYLNDPDAVPAAELQTEIDWPIA
jgi:effector-binding domain-containing protein